jgi:thymidine kinase
MEFLENTARERGGRGSIEVIMGSMFSGKTEELIRRLRRAQFAGLRVEIFKPSVDTRYSDTRVVSHDDRAIVSTPVENPASILLLYSGVDVIGIDEAQFFDASLVDVCNRLADEGVRVIVAGLDMDYRGLPFGPMPALSAVAEYVTKVNAICMRCGNHAHYSYRKSEEEQVVLLGEKDLYEPLCRHCYNKAESKRS